MPEVSVIIVSMNRPDLLSAAVDSILAHNKTPLEIIVTAYLYEKENLEAVRARYPDIQLVMSDTLRGFSVNNNLALREARGKYVFVVNDDTLEEMPVIDRLVADMEKLGDKVATVSPRIVFPNGKVQTCGRPEWTMRRYMRHYLHLGSEVKKGKCTLREGLFRTRTLNGACFLARRDVFRKAGWFDETYTFTPEDIALGARFEEMGYENWCDADVSITHLAGGTVSPLEPAIKPTRVKGALLYYSHESGLRYLILASFIGTVEWFRRVKYTITGHRSGHADVMFRTSRNVSAILWSDMSTLEIFRKYYNELKP